MAPQKRKNASNQKQEVSKEKEATMETTSKQSNSDTRYLLNLV